MKEVNKNNLTITNEYEIIGSLKYDLLKETNRPDIGGSNEFILRKI